MRDVNTHMKHILLVIFTLLSTNAFAAVDANVPNAAEVGTGRLTYMMWDVYDATLYAPEGVYSPTRPFALELAYLRDIPGEKIVNRAVDELRGQGQHDDQTLQQWKEWMQQAFPDVADGDQITGVHDGDGVTVFYFNGQKTSRINDADFTRAFFAIWLSEDTNAPDLRQKILGQEK